MRHRPHASLRYRPALDGLRGVAVLAVVLYHVNPSWVRGGWLGVDLFFVLSGFLITSLLLQEQDRWGGIDVVGFWTSRARRLLPALVVVCLAVLLAAAVWTVPGRRGSVGWDVLSALMYVANWRFLCSDEAYFDTLAMPSPVRHMWSLSIEEQYYLLFPLLLLGLSFFTRSRRVRTTVLLALALLSATWMIHLYVPGQDPSRVYYGTDTRAFELLIGAAAASALNSPQQRRRRASADRVIAVAAWPALALFILGFLLLPENAPGPFMGGLLVMSMLATVPIIAGWSPHRSAFQRALSMEWLRRLGLISYALYLWHWPVIVFVNPAATAVRGPALYAIQIGLSVGFAIVSYRFIEKPIRTGGLRALLPGRPRQSALVAGSAVPLALAGVLVLNAQAGTASSDVSGAGSTRLQPAPPAARATAAPPPRRTVVLLGNSIPGSLAVNFGQADDVVPTGNFNFGCEPFPGQRIGDNGDPVPVTAECVRWRGYWPSSMQAASPDVALFFLPQTLVSDFQDDQGVARWGTSRHDQFIRTALDYVRRAALANGAQRFAINTLSCHRLPDVGFSREVSRINSDERVKRVNAVATKWAKARGVAVIDTFGALCDGGYHSRINGVPLYADGLHFTAKSGPIYWQWLAPQLRNIAAGRPPIPTAVASTGPA